MIYWVEYDNDGKILGRCGASSREQILARPLALEIDESSFYSAPEIWAKIELPSKRLITQPGKSDPRKQP